MNPRTELAKIWRRTPAWVAAVCAIAAVCALSFAAGVFIPSSQEKCSNYCSQRKLEGHMVTILPWTTTAGMRGPGPSECKCFSPGTYGAQLR
jgi:hypothetical protein